MSIKTNTTSLQSLLEQVNALPEAGGTAQRITGVFTMDDTTTETAVDCGFQPDIVIVPVENMDGFKVALCFPFFEQSEPDAVYLSTVGTDHVGFAMIQDNGFLISVISGDTTTFNYIAIKYM